MEKGTINKGDILQCPVLFVSEPCERGIARPEKALLFKNISADSSRV